MFLFRQHSARSGFSTVVFCLFEFRKVREADNFPLSKFPLNKQNWFRNQLFRFHATPDHGISAETEIFSHTTPDPTRSNNIHNIYLKEMSEHPPTKLPNILQIYIKNLLTYFQRPSKHHSTRRIRKNTSTLTLK